MIVDTAMIYGNGDRQGAKIGHPGDRSCGTRARWFVRRVHYCVLKFGRGFRKIRPKIKKHVYKNSFTLSKFLPQIKKKKLAGIASSQDSLLYPVRPIVCCEGDVLPGITSQRACV